MPERDTTTAFECVHWARLKPPPPPRPSRRADRDTRSSVSARDRYGPRRRYLQGARSTKGASDVRLCLLGGGRVTYGRREHELLRKLPAAQRRPHIPKTSKKTEGGKAGGAGGEGGDPSLNITPFNPREFVILCSLTFSLALSQHPLALALQPRQPSLTLGLLLPRRWPRP